MHVCPSKDLCLRSPFCPMTWSHGTSFISLLSKGEHQISFFYVGRAILYIKIALAPSRFEPVTSQSYQCPPYLQATEDCVTQVGESITDPDTYLILLKCNQKLAPMLLLLFCIKPKLIYQVALWYSGLAISLQMTTIFESWETHNIFLFLLLFFFQIEYRIQTFLSIFLCLSLLSFSKTKCVSDTTLSNALLVSTYSYMGKIVFLQKDV